MSRHYPSFGKFYYGAPPLIRHRQWKRRRGWFDDVKKFSNEYLMEQKSEKTTESAADDSQDNINSGINNVYFK